VHVSSRGSGKNQRVTIYPHILATHFEHNWKQRVGTKRQSKLHRDGEREKNKVQWILTPPCTDEQRTLFAIVCLQSNEECIFHLGMMSKKAIIMKAPLTVIPNKILLLTKWIIWLTHKKYVETSCTIVLSNKIDKTTQCHTTE
jgi:hypothetical protein